MSTNACQTKQELDWLLKASCSRLPGRSVLARLTGRYEFRLFLRNINSLASGSSAKSFILPGIVVLMSRSGRPRVLLRHRFNGINSCIMREYKFFAQARQPFIVAQ